MSAVACQAVVVAALSIQSSIFSSLSFLLPLAVLSLQELEVRVPLVADDLLRWAELKELREREKKNVSGGREEAFPCRRRRPRRPIGILCALARSLFSLSPRRSVLRRCHHALQLLYRRTFPQVKQRTGMIIAAAGKTRNRKKGEEFQIKSDSLGSFLFLLLRKPAHSRSRSLSITAAGIIEIYCVALARPQSIDPPLHSSSDY